MMTASSSAIAQADVLVHVNDALDAAAIERISAALQRIDGVGAVGLAPAGEHLVRVSYDPSRTRSARLLEAVTALGHRAQLVGL